MCEFFLFAYLNLLLTLKKLKDKLFIIFPSLPMVYFLQPSTLNWSRKNLLMFSGTKLPLIQSL
jgi:hypothetical protein